MLQERMGISLAHIPYLKNLYYFVFFSSRGWFETFELNWEALCIK